MLEKVNPSLKLAGIYLLFSVVWIICTDLLVQGLSGTNLALLNQLQVFKGILFVGLSGVLLFYSSSRLYRNINANVQKYKALSELSVEAFGELQFSSGVCEGNEKLKQIFGAKDLTIVDFPSRFMEKVHPEDRAGLSDYLVQGIKSDEKLLRSVFRFQWSDGSYRRVEGKVYLIRDEHNGRVLRGIGSLIDLSGMKEVQARFKLQNEIHKKALASSVIRAQELERDRWAKELHDNVCQQLTAAKLMLGELRSSGQSQDNMLPLVKDTLASALNDIRQMSVSLRPPELGTITLIESIKILVENLHRVSTFGIRIDTGAFDESELTEEHKLMMYRIVQEQLNNIIKYAFAKEVQIELRTDSRQASLRVQDDGVGFDSTELRTGIGLKNIQSRLHLFKGGLEIRSIPGEGCQLSAWFPI